MPVKRMQEATVAAVLREPPFEPNGFFRVIFYRSPEFALKNGASGVEKKVEDRLTEAVRTIDRASALKTSVKSALKTSAAIMDAMEEDPKVTVPEIARAISVSTRTVNNHIRRLKEADLIRRVGPAKGGYWKAAE